MNNYLFSHNSSLDHYNFWITPIHYFPIIYQFQNLKIHLVSQLETSPRRIRHFLSQASRLNTPSSQQTSRYQRKILKGHLWTKRKHHPRPSLASSSSTTTTPVLSCSSYRLVRSFVSLTDFSLNGWFAERGWQRNREASLEKNKEGGTFIPRFFFFSLVTLQRFPVHPVLIRYPRCSTRRAFF